MIRHSHYQKYDNADARKKIPWYFGNGCDLFIPSATSTLSLLIGVVFFAPASPKVVMWDFN